MSRKFTLVALAAAGLLVLGCTGSDQSPTGLRDSHGPKMVLSAPSQQVVQDQINALFPSGGLRTAATVQLGNITSDLDVSKQSNAQKKVFALVNFIRQKQAAGQLLDPNGAAAPTTAEAADALVVSLYLYVGLTPSGTLPTAIDVDGAIAVVGPDGGTVYTGGEFPNAAVVFPAGALTQFVTVTIERLPDPAPTLYGQIPYPKYAIPFDVKLVPNVTLLSAATVAVCTVEPPNPGAAPSTAKLALAHITGATTYELLPAGTSAGPLPSLCDEALLASNDPRPEGGLRLALWQARRAGDRVLDVLSPQSAYAGHGGLLGQTTTFSPFVPADTANPLTSGSATESGADATCSLLTAVVPRCPDLVSTNGSVDATSLHLSFEFEANKYKADSALLYVTLDMDQNPATGFRGLTTQSGTDDTLIGGEYFISFGPSAALGLATVTHATCPTPTVPSSSDPQGGCTFTTVGTVPVTVTGDVVNITVPRNLIQDFDGKLNYKASSEYLYSPGIVDVITDVGSPVITITTGPVIL